MRNRLLRANMPPACATCVHAVRLTEEDMLCRKRGAVHESYHCRRYSYDPLKRVPSRTPPIPEGKTYSLE